MFKELDPLLHSELRLAVMSILLSVAEADFVYIRETTKATAGNLSVQIDKLSEAGYVEVERGFLGKRTDEPVTWMDVWKIIRSEEGLQKGVDGRRFLAYLNKADTLEDPCVAEKLMAQGQESGIMVICGSLQRSVNS